MFAAICNGRYGEVWWPDAALAKLKTLQYICARGSLEIHETSLVFCPRCPVSIASSLRPKVREIDPIPSSLTYPEMTSVAQWKLFIKRLKIYGGAQQQPATPRISGWSGDSMIFPPGQLDVQLVSRCRLSGRTNTRFVGIGL